MRSSASIFFARNYHLSLALLLSALLHGVVVLSVSQINITPSPVKHPPAEMEVILIPQEQIPLKSHAPIQTNATDGNKREKTLPPSPKINTHPHLSSSTAHAKPATQILSTAAAAPATEKRVSAPKNKAPTPKPRAQSQQQISPLTGHPRRNAKSISSEAIKVASPKPLPSAQELIAALNQQLAWETQHDTHQPRKRYINSNTTKYAATAYLDAWRKKIERIGKMSYPEKAKRQALSGSLVLAVDLNADGTVANVIVRQSSGYKILDKAAIQIVRLAAPFAKVPETLLQGYDLLSITRTWQFHSGTNFSAS